MTFGLPNRTTGLKPCIHTGACQPLASEKDMPTRAKARRGGCGYFARASEDTPASSVVASSQTKSAAVPARGATERAGTSTGDVSPVVYLGTNASRYNPPSNLQPENGYPLRKRSAALLTALFEYSAESPLLRTSNLEGPQALTRHLLPLFARTHHDIEQRSSFLHRDRLTWFLPKLQVALFIQSPCHRACRER